MMSSSNLKLLAQGNTAEIYEYSADKILKLFRPDFPVELIRAEYEKSKFISQELPNTPRVYNLTTYNTRHGIIYEKVNGPSMIGAALKSPHKLKQTSRQLAQLHFALHTHRITSSLKLASLSRTDQSHQPILTPVKTKLAADIDAAPALTSAEKSRIKSNLRTLPDGDSLLHFDFHPGNILFCAAGPTVSTSQPADAPVVIDWMTACLGNPCADIARTYLLLKYGELAHINFFLRKSARPLAAYIGKIYLTEYLKLSRLSPARPSLEPSGIEKWLLPVAAARLREWITPHEQKQLLCLIRQSLPRQL